jgi:hypothetical protein
MPLRLSSEEARVFARLEAFERQLADATRKHQATSQTLGRTRDIWRGIALLAIIGALALAILVFIKPPQPQPLVRYASVAPHTVVTALGPQPVDLPADPPAALSEALDRLNAAVASAPAQTTEQILRRASASGNGCLLIWNGNVPSLVFGMKPIRPNSLAHVLSDCADAVSRLH